MRKVGTGELFFHGQLTSSKDLAGRRRFSGERFSEFSLAMFLSENQRHLLITEGRLF